MFLFMLFFSHGFCFSSHKGTFLVLACSILLLKSTNLIEDVSACCLARKPIYTCRIWNYIHNHIYIYTIIYINIHIYIYTYTFIIIYIYTVNFCETNLCIICLLCINYIYIYTVYHGINILPLLRTSRISKNRRSQRSAACSAAMHWRLRRRAWKFPLEFHGSPLVN